jgi:flagellin-like protein
MKGISPFVAIVIVLAVTVSAGALITAWMLGLIRIHAERVEERAETELECVEGAILIHDASILCDLGATPDKLNFTVKNTRDISLYAILAQLEVQRVIYGPYNVTDYLTGKLFSEDYPLKPGYERTVIVNITDDIPYADADRVRIWTTRCPEVSDEVANVDCTPT